MQKIVFSLWFDDQAEEAQIVPVALGEMLSDPDSAKSQRVMEAMLQMGKIDVARLRQAYEA